MSRRRSTFHFTFTCAALRVQQAKNIADESWKQSQINDNRNKGTPLLCQGGKRGGHTARDSTMYPFMGCSESHPRAHFDGKAINNWKTTEKTKRNYILLYLACAETEKGIFAKLTSKDARICTCRQPSGYSERCPVTPGSHSGWTKGVTLQEIRSLRYRETLVWKNNIT